MLKVIKQIGYYNITLISIAVAALILSIISFLNCNKEKEKFDNNNNNNGPCSCPTHRENECGDKKCNCKKPYNDLEGYGTCE